MVVEKEEQPIAEIEKLKKFLPGSTMEELKEIFAYGEEIKAEGAKKKKEFWSKCKRDDFLLLLDYKEDHQEELEKKYKYLDQMDGLEKERFIEEYLHDDLLYSCKMSSKLNNNFGSFYYKIWKDKKYRLGDGAYFSCIENIGIEGLDDIAQNMRIGDGVTFYFGSGNFGDSLAKAISKIDLKDGTYLDLENNKIGVEGAEVLSHIKLKEGVSLDLSRNYLIGAEGAEFLSHMQLKEGVDLNLRACQIGDEGAQAIIDNMELKQNVSLTLAANDISDEMREKVMAWCQSYNQRGINCKVII